MYNKYEEMDKFLKVWRDIALENPNIDFSTSESQRTIYRYMIRMYTSSEESKLVFDQTCFPSWVERFRNTPNIDCFVSTNWKYFCQFVNKKDVYQEYFKLYIPLGPRHLYEGANKIFDYLSSQNIEHVSKIGKHIRFDNVVVRLTNQEDLQKVINFVNNDSYLKEGLRSPNPFAFQVDGLAVACDGGISYNTTVSTTISMYIDFVNKNNQLQNIGLQDYYNFLQSYYHNVFLSNNYYKFMNDFHIDEYVEDLPSIFLNYKQVIALIMKSMTSNFSFENYIEHYNMCVEGRQDTNYLSYKRDVISKDVVDVDEKETKTNYDDSVETLLLDAIEIMTKKYGREVAIKQINAYLRENNDSYITRTGDLRNRFIRIDMFNNLNRVLRQSQLTLEQYISLLQEKYQDSNIKEEQLNYALMCNYNKYEQQSGLGRNYMISALNILIKNGSYLGFTREKGARDTVLQNITSIDVKNILKQKFGYTEITLDVLEDCCEKYADYVMSLQNKLN